MEGVSDDEVRSLLLTRAAAADLALDDDLVDRLETYFQLLSRWNSRINLTGFSLKHPTDQAIDRLIVEPLVIARALKHPVSVWFDLGSGGGSPAIPIQLYRPAQILVLVESKERKAAFLREVSRQMRLEGVEVECTRIESVATGHRLVGMADLVTIRAVTPSEPIFASMQRLLRTGGQAALIGSESDRALHRPGFEVISTTEVKSRISLTLLSRT
jgi:16S rRNA (guanine527-N7)-methyltransferase